MFNRKRRTALVAGVLALSLVAAACGDDDDTATDTTTAPAGDATTTVAADEPTTTVAADDATTTAGSEAPGGVYERPDSLESVTLNASGATFPEGFYLEAIGAFQEEYPDVVINYDGTGSGTGREQFAQGVVDFAGSDSPASDDDGITEPFLYFPTVVAPVTVSYNLPSVEGLQLTPATIAGIFQGTITTWNDPAIAESNADADLPDTPVTVVVRSDSSGTTSNFTKFVDAAVGEGGDGTWTLGNGSTVEWGGHVQAAEGSGGVTQAIGATEGAIGYVDLSDSVAGGLQQALVENASGEFIEPTLEATTIAVEGAEVADDLTFFAGWSPAPGAYPIAAQTWLFVYTEQSDPAKAEATKAFVDYLLTDGQELAPTLDYAPLPPELAERAIAQLDQIGA